MIRLDKYLSEMNIGSRSRVKTYIRQGAVSINGETEFRAERKIEETEDVVTFKGEVCSYKKYVYYMLNKPKGVVSATKDNTCTTVTELLKETGRDDLFPVGRLDKDTEGLLLMTNDGELAHSLLSPRRHVKKIYYAELAHPLSEEDIRMLEKGVDIGEDKKTLPALVKKEGDVSVFLTITEGKFHQVKRMMQAVGNRVTFLKRFAVGGLYLDKELRPGEYRELRDDEREILLNAENLSSNT